MVVVLGFGVGVLVLVVALVVAIGIEVCDEADVLSVEIAFGVSPATSSKDEGVGEGFKSATIL